jgi:signal transduction histidine kinase
MKLVKKQNNVGSMKKIVSNIPKIMLFFTLPVTTAIIIALGWFNRNSFNNAESFIDHDFKLKQLTSIIIHLDEVLTMSARLAAESGDVQWEKRYIEYECKLDSALSEIKQLYPETFISEETILVDSANIKLVKFEKQALGLVRKGKQDSAAIILYSEEYEKNKKIYTDGIHKINQIINHDAQTRIKELRKQGLISNTFIIISLLILSTLWIISFLIMKNFLFEKTQINKLLNEQNKKLQIAKKKSEEKEKQLAELNATKDRFFSIITHDLRSPFNSILGFSSLLMEFIKEQDCEGIEKYTELIHQSSQKTMDLLSNLIEWSKSQTNTIKFNAVLIDLNKLITDTIELMNYSAHQKSISISSEIPEKATAFADKAMIETVLRNLISNAIKFTNQGGEIKVSIENMPTEWLISVTDNGVGINEDNLKNIFRIDKNISTKGTQNEAGTGLGLILCKEFIEEHNGRIWSESIVGKGSVFKFSLPLIISD